MNYYIIATNKPSEKLRHFLNSRTANYNCAHMNSSIGSETYKVITSDEPVAVVLLNRN